MTSSIPRLKKFKKNLISMALLHNIKFYSSQILIFFLCNIFEGVVVEIIVTYMSIFYYKSKVNKYIIKCM